MRRIPTRSPNCAGPGCASSGLLGLSDTPRAGAAALLAALAEQNIGVRLITGDHPITATAIANELGMPVTPQRR